MKRYNDDAIQRAAGTLGVDQHALYKRIARLTRLTKDADLESLSEGAYGKLLNIAWIRPDEKEPYLVCEIQALPAPLSLSTLSQCSCTLMATRLANFVSNDKSPYWASKDIFNLNAKDFVAIQTQHGIGPTAFNEILALVSIVQESRVLSRKLTPEQNISKGFEQAAALMGNVAELLPDDGFRDELTALVGRYQTNKL